jgi:hypothetical protein
MEPLPMASRYRAEVVPVGNQGKQEPSWLVEIYFLHYKVPEKGEPYHSMLVKIIIKKWPLRI